MNVLVVTPGHPGPDWKSLPPALTAPYLAALATPYAEDIRIIDLAVEEIDRQAPAPDIALLTSTMAQFTQVYEIAKYYKKKGTTVILGGPYASLAYDFDDRIKDVADCVVFGEGEKALPQALRDFSVWTVAPCVFNARRFIGGDPIQPPGPAGSQKLLLFYSHYWDAGMRQ